MPMAIDMCVQKGRRIRTASGPDEKPCPQKGEYVKVCFLEGEVYRGHIEAKEKPTLDSVVKETREGGKK